MLEMLFSALFGGATGLIGTLIGKGFAIWELKEKRKNLAMEQAHELALQERQAALRKTEMESELAIADLNAWQAGRVASYQQAGPIGESYRWVNAVRGLTRPVLTVLLLALTGVVFMLAVDVGMQSDIVNQIVYLTAMAVAWWFGDRAPQQRR